MRLNWLLLRLHWLLAVALLAVVPSEAVADPAADAAQHFKRAKTYHQQGDYTHALQELMAAYDAEPTPGLLYGIAQTHVKLGQCAEAITFYQRFIDTKPSQDAITRALAAIEACKAPAKPATPATPAEPETPKLTAKEHFSRAASFHKQGDYASALRELTSAYDAEPTPSLMYAIAQTYVKLGQCPEAITFYRRFIDSKPKREAVERALAAIDACKPTGQAVAAPPATAPKPAAMPPANEVTKIETRNPPVEVIRKELPAAVMPIAPQPAHPPVDIVGLDREDRYDRHPTRKWAYIGAGLGAGAMLVGTIFGAAANATQKSFDDAGCGDRNQVLGADAIAHCLDDERRGARNVRLGNGFLIGGGGALALFAVLIILDPGNIERPRFEQPKVGRATVSLSTNAVQLSIPW
jgi:tetratricopeptide (TPR) repeat protein